MGAGLTGRPIIPYTVYTESKLYGILVTSFEYRFVDAPVC